MIEIKEGNFYFTVNPRRDDFTFIDCQIILHLINKIEEVDKHGKYLKPKQLQRQYTLTAQEYSEALKIPIAHCYNFLEQAIDKLMGEIITIKQPELDIISQIKVCSHAEYYESKEYIIIEFTDSIIPYLARVKTKFRKKKKKFDTLEK